MMKITRFKINIEDLKWEMRGGPREITTSLNITLNRTRQRDIVWFIIFNDERRIDNYRTGLGHTKVIPRNRTTQKIIKCKTLTTRCVSCRQIIMVFKKGIKGRVDREFARESTRIRRIKRETANIVGKNARDGKGTII